MSSSRTSIALLLAAAAFALCVGYSAASIPSPGRYNTERVYDFVVSEARDQATWHAFGREWRVQLYLSDVTEDNSDYFYGTLEGDSSAVVSFSLLPGNGLSGMIAARNQTWWITARPVEEHDNSEEEADLGVFMFREPLAEHFSPSFDADVVLPPLHEPVDLHLNDDAADLVPAASVGSSSSSSEERSQSRGRRATVNKYKVGVFFDQKWALASNNPWASKADTLGLFNDVNAVYRAAGLATFTVVYGKQVTNAQSDINTMLSFFSNTATKSIAMAVDKSYTNYVWLVGSNVGGLAYVGTSCRSSSLQTQKTAVVGLVSYSRLWTVKTIAHELAHNRGANHHFEGQCSGQTTKSCQCSVMSYCFPTASNNPSGAVNLFSATSINEMKAAGCY